MADNPTADSFSEADHETDVIARADLGEVFRTLARRWKIIAAFTLTFAALAAGFAYHLSNYYISTVQILIDPEGSQYLDSDLAKGQRSTDAHALNQQYILTSAKVLSQVVASEHLADDKEFGAAAPYDARPEVRSQRALSALQKVVVATLNKASFVIDLSVTSNDPEKAARIANGIANTYILTRASMNNGIVRQATSDLSAQLASLEQKVIDGDRAVQAYKATHNLIDVDGRPVVERQIAEANTEISKISASIAENEAIVAELAHARSDQDYLRSMLDSYLTPTIVTLRAQYYQAVQQQSVLESSLGGRHPLLANAKAKARSTLSLLDEQLENLHVSISRNVERLKDQRNLLQKNLNNLQDSLKKDDSSMVELRELERRLSSDRLVYETFLLRTRQLAGQEQTVSENPQIISAALAPLEKSGPRRSLIVAGAAALGLLIGSGLAIGRERSAGRAPFARREKKKDSEPVASQPDAKFAYWADDMLKDAGSRSNYCTVIYTSPTVSQPHYAVFKCAQAAAAKGRDVLLVDAAPDTALTIETASVNRAGLRNSMALRRIVSDLVDVPNVPRLHIMPAGYKIPRIPTRRSTGPEHLVAWLNAADLHFDLVVVDGGRLDERQALPEIERAADKVSILAYNQDKELESSIRMLKELGQQSITPMLIPREMGA